MKLAACIAAWLCGFAAFGSEAALRFEATPGGLQVVASLSAERTVPLPTGWLSQEQGEAVLSLALLGNDGKTTGPKMLGRYEHTGSRLAFTPRVPLAHGASYRASLHVAGRETSLDYTPPAPEPKVPPKVLHVYPSASVLPANQLRFYLHFDRPMRGGKEIFTYLSLVDDAGREIEAPWLDDEIWDEKDNVLVLYIHPGRIKRGVELRESLGPVLRENQSYSLVVRGAWTDLEGNKLGSDTIKKFRTKGEDLGRLEMSGWKLRAPAAETREDVTLFFGKSVDYRGLLSGLSVTGAHGQLVEGTVSIGADETSWAFKPSLPWKTGRHRIVVSPDLEDVCGNTPERPFAVDLSSAKAPAQALQMSFETR